MGVAELLIVLLIVIVLFGAVKLPKLARSLGQTKTEFERGLSADEPGPEDQARPQD